MPKDRSRFLRVHAIDPKTGEIMDTETPKKQEEVGVPVPKTIYTRAVEKLHDKLIAHALGFIWDPPKPEELVPYDAPAEKGDH